MINFIKYFFLSLILVLVSLTACTQNKTAINKPHKMGHKMDVRYYPVKGAGWVANHTYPEAFTNDGKREAWPSLGGDEGGKVLDKTTTECDKDCIDMSTVNYIMSEPPCIWPKKGYYGVVGVCWQATNRGLFYTDKNVSEVPFYSLVEPYFGTWGIDKNTWCFTDICRKARKLYAWSNCKESVKKNYPWQASVGASQESYNSRITLYNKYFGDKQDVNLKSLSPKNKYFQYLQSLVSLNVVEKLGLRVTKNKSDMILKIHEKWFDIIPRIELIDGDHDKYLSDMNDAFNKQLDDYRIILTDEEYEKLFSATKKHLYDIMN